MKFKQIILGHWQDTILALGEDGIVYEWSAARKGWVPLPSTVLS